MGFFNFPHTRTYDTDLGWLILEVNRVKELLNQYLENAVITFADPITWDITEQYTTLTMVVDSDGTAYLSKQPVPTGIDITNRDYWLPIFNYDDNINTLRSQIAYNAGENSTAGIDLTKNDLVFWRGYIYKVLTDMPAGTAFISGTNIAPYTVDEKITDQIATVNEKITQEIGTVNERITQEIAGVGDQITDINRNLTEAQTDIGNLSQSVTNINNTLNEVIDTNPLNVLLYGVKNDGSEDASSIINTLTATNPLYFPPGIYRIDSPLNLQNSIFGVQYDTLEPEGTIFVSHIGASFVDDAANQVGVIQVAPTLTKSINIKNITIRMVDGISGYEQGLHIVNVVRGNTFFIEGVNVFNPFSFAAYFEGFNGNSRMLDISNCTVWGYYAHYANSGGFYLGYNTFDSRIHNVAILGVCRGMYLRQGLYILNNIHIWCGAVGGTLTDTEWRRSVALQVFESVKVFGNNLYLDSAFVGCNLSNYAELNVNNVITYVDSTAPATVTNGSFINCAPTAFACVRGGLLSSAGRYQNIANNIKFVDFFNLLADVENFNSNTQHRFIPLRPGASYKYAGGGSQGWCKRVARFYGYYGSAHLRVTTSGGKIVDFFLYRNDSTLTATKTILLGTTTCYYKNEGSGFYSLYMDVGTGNEFTVELISVSGTLNMIDWEHNLYTSMAKAAVVTQSNSSGLTEIT